MIDGVCSSLKQATLGIKAGSGFATEELACLLLDVCDDALKCYPTLDLTEFVDDLTLGQAGPSWFNVAYSQAQQTMLSTNWRKAWTWKCLP